MRLIASLILFAFISCNGYKNESSSKTLLKAEGFHFRNLNSFIIDSLLWKSYYTDKNNGLNLKKVTAKDVDSAFLHNDLYLYSWQQRNSTFTEYTVLSDNGDPGLSIHYLIFDKKGKLVSNAKVAGLGKDAGGPQYETRSYFKGLDTLVLTRAETMLVDYKTLEPLKHSKGDTAIYNMIIGKDGAIKEFLIYKNSN